MTDQLYRRRCDSVVHEPEGAWLENDTHKEGAQEPIVDKCLDWHPDLVWYEKVEIDYEGQQVSSCLLPGQQVCLWIEEIGHECEQVSFVAWIGGDDEPL